MSLNSDVASGVLQVGTFVRLPPWASTCPDPDSDAASCRVYSGAWRQAEAWVGMGGGRGATTWQSSQDCFPPWAALSPSQLSSPALHALRAVQQGDFVYGIASMFRVSVANLLAVNTGLTTDTVLQVSRGWVSAVKEGVWRIAHTSSRLDPLPPHCCQQCLSANFLQAGQRVKIPPFDSSCGNGGWVVQGQGNAQLQLCPAPSVAAHLSKPSLLLAPTGILSSPPTTGVFDCRAYRVKTGDSLSAIALKFETTVRWWRAGRL